MIELDIMTGRREIGRARGHGILHDRTHARRRRLGDEQFADQRKRLIERGIDARDHQQVREHDHEVDLACGDKACARNERGGDPQTQDRVRRVRQQAVDQLALRAFAFGGVDRGVQAGQVVPLLIGGADLAHAVERLLDALRHLQLRHPIALEHRLHRLARSEQQGKSHRNAPKRGDRQLPAGEQRAHEHDGCRDHSAPKLAEHMAIGVLHHLHVAHDGFGQIRQVAPPEKRQRQFAQALGDLDALIAAFLVVNAVGVVILLPIGQQQRREEHRKAYGERHCARQIGAFAQVLHEPVHHLEQKRHAGHGDQVRDARPEHAALHARDALIRKEVLLLKRGEHQASPPFIAGASVCAPAIFQLAACS